MKKLIISGVMVSLLAAGGVAYASGDRCHGGERGKNPEKRVMMMKKKLDLTDAQAAEIKAIYQNATGDLKGSKRQFHKRLKQLDPSSADYMSEVTALADEKAAWVRMMVIKQGESRAKVNAVLTPEQQEKMKAMMEKRHDKMKKKWKERGED